MPLFVLPPDEALPGQVLLTDQGGIALFYAGTRSQFRLCLRSVPGREQPTSLSETVWPPPYALVDVLVVPPALPLLAAASALLLFVVFPLGVDVRPARFVVSASPAPCLGGMGAVRPAPVAAKSSAMPAHNGLWPNDHYGLEDRRTPTIKLYEEQAIAVRELDATAHLTLQHEELLPQRGILCFKSALGLEQRANQIQVEQYQRGHCGRQ
jgi:hypothetical protein